MKLTISVNDQLIGCGRSPDVIKITLKTNLFVFSVECCLDIPGKKPIKRHYLH